MEYEGDSQPLFDDELAPLKIASDFDQSDSEDESNLSSLADNDRYESLNIPAALRNVLNMYTENDTPTNATQDDSESDDDSIYKGPQLKGKGVDIEKLNEEIANNKNKFANFPLMPTGTETEEDKVRKVVMPTGTKNSREKKKRRDKGKKQQKQVDILEEAAKAKRAQNKKLAQLFANFANESGSENEEEVEEVQHKKNKKDKKQKNKGRRTRKEVTPNELKVDENGERLVRTTEFLDTDTDDSSSDGGERVLTKKEELEMLRESERMRRANNARLKPVYNIKTFDEFVQRSDQREIELLEKLEKDEKEEIERKKREKIIREKRQKIQELLKKQVRPVFSEHGIGVDKEDNHFIIENDPHKIAEDLLSPERARNHIMHWSPVKPATSALRNHNKSILTRITNEGYQHRLKMEEAAKARGQFMTAKERAKKLLEKEKNALLIDQQVKLHFEKNKHNTVNDDEDDEEDLNYEGGEAAEETIEDDYMNQLSGQDEDEEEEEEEEFAVEDHNTDLPHKRKVSMDDSADEDEDMGAQAMKRWKGKKVRKSIFDDSDDEEEDTKNKVAQKPVPAHSISNFFKAKEIAVEPEEPVEEKPLTRLKRVIQRDDDEEEEEEDEKAVDSDAMDIDEPVIIKKINAPKSPKPSGPKERNDFYMEEEAEESEDEFYDAGGEDIDNGEDLDEFEEDEMLVEDNNEIVDEAALRDTFNRLDAESDSNMIQRLLKDVTGGGLRKQKAAAEAGLMLDDIDLYDEEDNDLIAIRRAAAARRRKLLKKKGGDPLENLMSDPKTAAFAKAAQAIPEEAITGLLSDDDDLEDEDEQAAMTTQSESIKPKLIIREDDEDEEDEDIMDINSVDEEDEPVVKEFNSMESPLRGGLVTITSADDDIYEEEDDYTTETVPDARSPLNNRRTKSSLFGSPASMERFKRLFSETANTSDAPRVGFGSVARTKSNEGDEEEESGRENRKNMSSIGGSLASPSDTPKKSKLSGLSKKRDAFKYADS